MARIETDPNYSSPTFSRATAATDLFKKEDVQALAAALSTHDHTTGKGLPMAAGSIPNGTITSAMIADATIDTADLKDGAVTSAKILDGTIATGDLANNAVTNAKLGTDTARLNLLVNGGFEIWQRGNGPFTTVGVFTADRWLTGQAGTDTLSVSKDTANVDVGSSACAACTFVLGTGAGASFFYQQLKTTDGVQLVGRTYSFSARVRCATANAVRVTSNANGTGGVAVQSAFHTGGGTYQTLTVTNTVPVDATFVSVTLNFVASCTAYLDNATLVVGSVPADYAPLHPADDLARCLRYYEQIGGKRAQDLACSGYAATGAGQSAIVMCFHRASKAVVPTATKVGTWSLTNASQPTVYQPSIDHTGVSLVAVAAGYFNVYTTDTTCFVSVEANP